MISSRRTAIVSLFLLAGASAACKSSASKSDGQVKEIDSIDNAGKIAGRTAWSIKCADGWVNEDGTDRILVDTSELGNNVEARYCNRPTGNRGRGGGGPGPTQGNFPSPSDGLVSGLRPRISGDANCQVAMFIPRSQGGSLKGMDVSCGRSNINGSYTCSDNFTCAKDQLKMSIFDDQIEIKDNSQRTLFSRTAAVLPTFTFQAYVTDTCEGVNAAHPPVPFNVKDMTQPVRPLVDAFCRALAMPMDQTKASAGHIWGCSVNGECVNGQDQSGFTQAAVVNMCLASFSPVVEQRVNAMLGL